MQCAVRAAFLSFKHSYFVLVGGVFHYLRHETRSRVANAPREKWVVAFFSLAFIGSTFGWGGGGEGRHELLTFPFHRKDIRRNDLHRVIQTKHFPSAKYLETAPDLRLKNVLVGFRLLKRCICI